MATFTATPTSTYGITDVNDDAGGSASTVTAHVKVSDNDDATYVYQNIGNNTDSLMMFGLTSDMVDPVTIDSIQVTARVNILGGWSDDTLEFKCQAYESDGVTPLTDEITLATAAAGADQIPENTWTNQVKSFNITTNTAANWTDAEFRFYWVYSKSKGSDGAYIATCDIDIDGTYTAAIGLLTTDLTQSSTVSQSALVDQTHLADTTEIYSANTVNQVALTAQNHLLGAQDFNLGSTIAGGGLSIPQTLETTDLNQTNTSSQSALTSQTHLAQTTDFYGTATIEDGQIQHIVRTTDFYGTSTATENGISQNHILGSQSLSIGSSIQEDVILIVEIAETTDLDGTSTVSQAAISQTHIAQTTDLTGTYTISGDGVIHTVQLVPESLSIGFTETTIAIPLYEKITLPNVPFDFYGIPVLGADFNLGASITAGGVDTEHYLQAGDFVLENPTQAAPIYAEHHISAGSLVEDGNTITEGSVIATHQLAFVDLDNTGEIQGVEVVATHLPLADELPITPTVSGGVITATHELAIDDLDGQHVIEPAAASSEHGLSGGLPTIGETTISSGDIATTHVLSSESLRTFPSVTQESADTEHWLSSESLSVGTTIEEKNATPVHDAETESLVSTQSVSAGDIAHTHVISLGDLYGGHAIESVVAHITHDITLKDITSQPDNEISSVEITKVHNVIPADLEPDNEIESGEAQVVHDGILPNDLDAQHEIKGERLDTITAYLSVANLDSNTGYVSDIPIDQSHDSVTAESLAQPSIVEEASLVQTHPLGSYSAESTIVIEPAAIHRAVNLTLLDTGNANQIEAVPSLDVTSNLLLADTYQSENEIESTTAVHAHTLQIADVDGSASEIQSAEVTHAHSLSLSPGLDQDGNLIKTIIILSEGDLHCWNQDTTGEIESLVISGTHNLSPANAASSGEPEQPAITQDHLVTVGSLDSIGHPESPIISASQDLLVADLDGLTNEVSSLRVYFGHVVITCPILEGFTNFIPPSLASHQMPYLIEDRALRKDLEMAVCADKKVINI